MLCLRLRVRIDRLIDRLPAEAQRDAPDGPELCCSAAGNWNRHCDDGLPIFVIGHHGGQIGAADEREQSLFILAQTRQTGFQVIQNVDVGHDCVMRNALQSLVTEMAGLAPTDHRRGDSSWAKPRRRVSAATIAGTSPIWFSVR